MWLGPVLGRSSLEWAAQNGDLVKIVAKCFRVAYSTETQNNNFCPDTRREMSPLARICDSRGAGILPAEIVRTIKTV